MTKAFPAATLAGSNDAEFELNPSLDIGRLASSFASRSRLQIMEFLTPASANMLRADLEASSRWRHVFNAADRTYEVPGEDWDQTPAANREPVLKVINEAAAFDFQYQYDNIRVPDRREERLRSDAVVDRFAYFLSSPSVLETLMQITGSTHLKFADCQATRYRTGDFLTPHDDTLEGMHRCFAYVLSLTPDWLPRWGGLLHFVDRDGGVDETITPRFNALSLFAIGQSHYVSQVATYAPTPRISVTGWLRSKAPC